MTVGYANNQFSSTALHTTVGATNTCMIPCAISERICGEVLCSVHVFWMKVMELRGSEGGGSET
jgi:hypothetical protein